jgi:hypothetical protein
MMSVEVSKREIDTAFENLANSIVEQAVIDYRKCLRGESVDGFTPPKKSKREIEKFFLSDWCDTLTKVDGKMILNRLRKEYKDECKSNTTDTKSD